MLVLTLGFRFYNAAESYCPPCHRYRALENPPLPAQLSSPNDLELMDLIPGEDHF